MPKNKRVTLKLIAQRAGTSIGTVDRALKDREGVKKSTKERVLTAARELGYIPNPFSNALRRMGAVRLAMVYPREPEAFYRPMTAGINAAVRDLSDFGVEAVPVRYAVQKQSLQEQTLEQLYTGEFRGIAVNAAGPRIARQINRLAETGLPVITFNTDAANSMRKFFVGNDSLQSGRMGAAILGCLLCGKGAVTVLGNFAETMPFSERFGGFCETIHEDFPGLTLYPCAECCADRALAARSLATLLESVPQIKGVFCTGYTSTVGAVSALQQLNRKDVTLVGYDTSEELLSALREGWCDALLYQDPFRQGYSAVQTLTHYVLGGEMPDIRRTHILANIVIRQNADSYRRLLHF